MWHLAAASEFILLFGQVLGAVKQSRSNHFFDLALSVFQGRAECSEHLSVEEPRLSFLDHQCSFYLCFFAVSPYTKNTAAIAAID
jgi:hypothetical protein